MSWEEKTHGMDLAKAPLTSQKNLASPDFSEKPGNFRSIELCSFCLSCLKAFKIKCLYKASSQILKAGCSLHCKSAFVLLPLDYREYVIPRGGLKVQTERTYGSF